MIAAHVLQLILNKTSKCSMKIRNLSLEQYNKRFMVVTAILVMIDGAVAGGLLPVVLKADKCPSMVRVVYLFDLILLFLKIPMNYI